MTGSRGYANMPNLQGISVFRIDTPLTLRNVTTLPAAHQSSIKIFIKNSSHTLVLFRLWYLMQLVISAQSTSF